MRCRKIISCLNAYADDELAEKKRLSVKVHLAGCEACRKRLENIRGLEAALNDTLHVPSVPHGFAVEVLEAARKRSTSGLTPQRTYPFTILNPLRWIANFSAPMRVAAGVTVLLAVVLGWSLDGEWMTGKALHAERNENLYGVEWFDPAPPDSIGSIYIAMTTPIYEQGNGQ